MILYISFSLPSLTGSCQDIAPVNKRGRHITNEKTRFLAGRVVKVVKIYVLLHLRSSDFKEIKNRSHYDEKISNFKLNKTF